MRKDADLMQIKRAIEFKTSTAVERKELFNCAGLIYATFTSSDIWL